MKKIGGLLLAVLLMLGCAAAFAAEDADYLTIEIAGHAYVLGESTLADFVGNGWTHYTVEADGMYSMLDEENGSYMYLLPEEGSEGLVRAVNAIDLTTADGVPYSYCGIHTDDTGEALSRLFEMEADEEGGTQGYADLSDGRMVWVYTQGYRLMLGCVGEKKSAGSARSEEGSLRDEIPQAGLGGSPTFPFELFSGLLAAFYSSLLGSFRMTTA